jgi:hypothetical protein
VLGESAGRGMERKEGGEKGDERRGEGTCWKSFWCLARMILGSIPIRVSSGFCFTRSLVSASSLFKGERERERAE